MRLITKVILASVFKGLLLFSKPSFNVCVGGQRCWGGGGGVVNHAETPGHN
jgi:hypothetical protein